MTKTKNEQGLTDLESAILKQEEAKKNKNPFKKKQRKYPSVFQNMSDYFSEYCDYTSIHGFKYFGEQKRSVFEKLWWVIVFLFSLSMCTYLILKIYEKWENSPVLVSFAKSPMPIWEIPFPAVTICSETKSRQTIYNFTDYYHKVRESRNLTATEQADFEKISLICDNHLYMSGNLTAGFDTVEFIEKVAPPFEESLWQCKWGDLNQTCDTLFTRILTEDGVCYTSNMLHRDEIYTDEVIHQGKFLLNTEFSEGWTLENGYSHGVSINDTYPRRALSSGVKAGFQILLRAYDYDLDYVCRGPVQGFKILLHQPGEIPRVSMQYFRAPLNQEIIVAVKPDMMTTSEALMDYDPHRRLCYFSNERQLRFYNSYTQANCEVECLANFTLKTCGCVAYHMPRDEGTPICGSGNIACMKQAQIDLIIQEAQNAGKSSQCDCLQGCSSLVYNAETSQADFNWFKVFQGFKANTSEFPGIQLTRLTIFFKEMQFITSERNELYGGTDFLANCGGLLGLFTGFSFLSLIEIIYFLSLRLMCNLKNYGIHYWSGSEELLNDDQYIHPEKKMVDKEK